MDLKKLYMDDACPKLRRDCAFENVMQIPTIKKVCLNIGIGEAIANRKLLDQAMDELRLISGQKPVMTVARKSIAGFKLREGYPIGCKVTLRKKPMWDFLEKIIHVCLPRVRDFRGLNPKSFDGFGNYSFGIKEQIIFPEIDFDKVESVRGMNIVVCTTAQHTQHGLLLLKEIGFPFESQD